MSKLRPVVRRARDRHYHLQCHGKDGHSTTDEAQAHISLNHPHEPMDIYRCPWCGMFHIGHKKDKNDKKDGKNRNPKKETQGIDHDEGNIHRLRQAHRQVQIQIQVTATNTINKTAGPVEIQDPHNLT